MKNKTSQTFLHFSLASCVWVWSVHLNTSMAQLINRVCTALYKKKKEEKTKHLTENSLLFSPHEANDFSCNSLKHL